MSPQNVDKHSPHHTPLFTHDTWQMIDWLNYLMILSFLRENNWAPLCVWLHVSHAQYMLLLWFLYNSHCWVFHILLWTYTWLLVSQLHQATTNRPAINVHSDVKLHYFKKGRDSDRNTFKKVEQHHKLHALQSHEMWDLALLTLLTPHFTKMLSWIGDDS